MRTDRFFMLLNDIDDKYIEEADTTRKQTTKLIPVLTIAASALLIAGIATVIIKNLPDTAIKQTIEETVIVTNTEPVSPGEIGDIKEAKLTVEDNCYTLTDRQKLQKLKEALTDATSQTPSGSSWGILELTQTDGRTITIELASDTCAIWRSGDKYYRYGSSDNAEEVYSLFGIELGKLHAPKEE